MKTLEPVMQEIMKITAEMETKYPELYKYLNETPMEICDVDKKTLCVKDLKEYLETLKEQLKHHIETHKNKK